MSKSSKINRLLSRHHGQGITEVVSNGVQTVHGVPTPPAWPNSKRDAGWALDLIQDDKIHHGDVAREKGCAPSSVPDNPYPEDSISKQNITYWTAWIYPELPWGAPPSWSRSGKIGGTFLIYWELCTCCACVYVALTIPYIAGIDEAKGDDSIFGGCVIDSLQNLRDSNKLSERDKLKSSIAICDLFCDFLFVLDLIMNFFTARWVISREGREHWKLVDDLPTIRKMYVWHANLDGKPTWVPGAFFVDFLGVIPWQYIDCMGVKEGAVKFLRLLRLTKLIRLYRLYSLIEALHLRFPTSSFAIHGLQLIMILFLMAHWLCCIWFRVGYSEHGWVHRPSTGLHSESGERAVDMYDWVEHQEVYEWVTSFYWTITTMTTIGYGDISAFTQQERCIAVVVMVLGCGFFAWSTGTITELFTTQSRCKEQFLNKIDQLSQFMASRALPDELRTKIRSYYMLRFPTMKVFDEEQILQDLPVALARQVKESLFCDIVARCMLFQTMNDDMVTEICVRLRSVYKIEGIQVTREGDLPDALYIVRFGVVSMYARSRFLGNANSGDIFGENALLGLTPDGKRNRSTVCLTMCELCELRKDELHELLRMEHFNRGIRVLVHSHLFSMKKHLQSHRHVKENSFYCVNWSQLAQIVGIKKSVIQVDTTPEQGSMLCTRCTVVINNIVVSSEAESKWVVLFFHWSGERYGPTFNWSYPFFVDPENVERSNQNNMALTCLKVCSVLTLYLKHHTNDWKSKSPIQVKLYQVKDPVHWVIPEQDSDECILNSKKYGLQLLGSGDVPVDDIMKECSYTLEANVSAVNLLFTKERYANVKMPMSSMNAEWKQLGMSISMNRILPAQSRWRRVMGLLKNSGASEFFTQQQRNLVAKMFVSFDQIIEKAMTEGQSPTDELHQITKSIEKNNANISNLHEQIHGLVAEVNSQKQVLSDLCAVTQELTSILRLDSPLSKLCVGQGTRQGALNNERPPLETCLSLFSDSVSPRKDLHNNSTTGHSPTSSRETQVGALRSTFNSENSVLAILERRSQQISFAGSFPRI